MGGLHYYNEIDPYCAAWLRNLMDAGHIPAGDIDTRSIEDVIPDELRGYRQCHFFAGLGGWAYAVQLAGWSDRELWTGSCPCQPFSAAGKGLGFKDERHLWPAWQHLIAQCRPAVIFGEQVASKDADPWIDLVHADMEGMDYAFGCEPFPSAGIGSAHIRDRNIWVADLRGEGLPERAGNGRVQREALEPSAWQATVSGSATCGMADSDLSCAARFRCDSGASSPSAGIRNGLADRGKLSRLANPDRAGRIQGHGNISAAGHGHSTAAESSDAGFGFAGATNGFWRTADWLRCRDGKWRPVEPGTFPLAHGISNRVGRLRAYGNAINPWQAAEFIRAYAEARGLSVADPAEVVAA
ncbi:DNA (cytosine-5)-methyltransferase 1 [Dyella sp. SG562]|uniref:DNA cytosine methyltransferase n=1 Tax=Dyella sp. SG562 TaxID=2587017 RepID=UPI001421F345|nr:DNA cytosine methyltransferase [Dyella sp. SG562]NII73203.1 DNA (cytosine-5)-methyltransferase 1 [Dyella sp. SG562]